MARALQKSQGHGQRSGSAEPDPVRGHLDGRPFCTVRRMTPAFSICVYCGSRPGQDARFAHLAKEVGRWIGANGGQLVYGGGNTGLMGTVADAALAAGGRVVGVIPHALVEREY